MSANRPPLCGAFEVWLAALMLNSLLQTPRKKNQQTRGYTHSITLPTPTFCTASLKKAWKHDVREAEADSQRCTRTGYTHAQKNNATLTTLTAAFPLKDSSFFPK